MRIPALWLPLVALLAASPNLAHADPTAPSDPQVTRLLEAKRTLKWNYAPQGTGERYGHAEALVQAPAEKIAKLAADFGRYRELHRKFKTARVVAKEGDSTDVYMRYPVRIGSFEIEFHEVMRFGRPRVDGGQHVLEGNGLHGDMKKGFTRIVVKPVDDTHAILQVDVLLVPKLPAPQSLVDEELRDGAEDFVNGLKDRAQGWAGPVTSL